MINGDSAVSADQEFVPGVTHRFRLINIGPASTVRYLLRQDTTVVQWQARAKDGADLPEAVKVLQPASAFVAVGETFDFDWLQPSPGTYELSAAFGVGKPVWRQRIVVR
jgi:FtsP/CotA-like multicopper oxidase with cupredoxin domain